MRKILFVFILSCTSIVIYSQEITSSVSENFDLNLSDYSPAKVVSGNSIFFYRENGSRDHLMYGFGWNRVRLGITLVKIQGINTIKTQAIADDKHIFGPFMTDMKKINGKIFVVYHQVAKKNTFGNVMAAEVDTATLLTGEPKVIADIESTDYKLKFSENLQYSFVHDIESSPDGKKNLVFISGGGNHFFLSVFDENMNILWSKKVELNTKELIAYNSFAVDNNGNAYVAYRMYNGKNNLYIVNANTNPIDFSPFNDSSNARRLKLLPSKDGNVMHVCSYYYDIEPRCLKGVFYTSIQTNDLKQGSTSKTPFPKAILDAFISQGNGYSDAKGLGIYAQMKEDYFELGDGTLNMTGEIFSINGGETQYHFWEKYGSILNTRISGNGILFSLVPKFAYTHESNIGNIFFAFPYKDKAIILYNEKVESVNRDISDKPEEVNGYKGLALLAAIIDNKGNITRKVAINLSADNYLALTNMGGFQISANDLVIPFIKARNDGVMKKAIKFVNLHLQEH